MITPLTWMRSANGRKGITAALVSSTNSLPISCFYREQQQLYLHAC